MYHSNKKECGVNSCAPFMGFCPLPSPIGPTGATGSVESNPYNLYV